MTNSLLQKLQELKGKVVSCKPYYSNMVKLSDVEDFVELYQKTRQTLRQQIKEWREAERKLPREEQSLAENVLEGVLDLLDRPNEDYIVIPKRQLQDELDEYDEDVKKSSHGWHILSDEQKVRYAFICELLWLPNKKEK